MKKLVILGAGTAGCLAAAALARRLNPGDYQITVLESALIDSIGVGESVLPSFISFLRKLGLNEQEFIQATGAGIKLGVQFREWQGKGDSFFHPLGGMGCQINGHDFFNCWLKARAADDRTPLQDYAPAAVMASQQRFELPLELPPDSPLTGADYALQFDAGRVCQVLREFAERHRVRFIKAHVVRVNLGKSGDIESLELSSRETVAGDLFIDCSGRRGLLIHEALGSGFEDWSHFLPCDRAMAIQTAGSANAQPYSVSTARESGWTWRIPLQNHVSDGYVFASQFCNDQQAIQVLLGAAEAGQQHEPCIIPFRNGVCKQWWKRNCIALGLAGGFLEPLQSTAIHLAIRGVERMLALFPNLADDHHEWQPLAAEYDRCMRADYEEIRDFILIHYHANKRTDSEFWRHCQSMPVPDSLTSRLELFKARATLKPATDSLFKESNWLVALTGLGVQPRQWHPFLDTAGFDRIHQEMRTYRASLKHAVQQLPLYGMVHNADRAPTSR